MSVQFIGHTQLENATYLYYLGTLITNDAKCKREIKFEDCYGKSSIQN